MFINKDDWQPVDGLILEENALNALKCISKNSLVVAGPGAGKTELLAQKSSYLLETNECKYPKKILAISFKRDAAKNLSERVIKRCGINFSNRFVSKTYDSFAKSILDHFRLAIPEKYRPTADYSIIFNYKDFDDIFRDYDQNFYNTNNLSFLVNSLINTSLPISPSDEISKFTKGIWMNLTSKAKKSNLSFPMITRLAEFIIKSNPKLKHYLQSTYSHVFLDEFQDTTTIQYDLVKTCFFSSGNILTAVGDDKQTIMSWAGAVKNIFKIYESDFKSEMFPLLMNHRSAPKLVALQKILVKELLNQNIPVSPSSKWKKDEGDIQVWISEDYKKEAVFLANYIDKLIINGISPRDICILVKQKVDDYANLIITELANLNIDARNENEYQDLLTEDLILFIMNCFYVASKPKAVEKSELLDFVFKLLETDDENEQRNVENDLHNFLSTLRKSLGSKSKLSEDLILKYATQIINYIGLHILKSAFPQYKDESFTNHLIDTFSELYYNALLKQKSWSKAIEEVKGVNSIPIMTTHKSKGLEYNTVIFVGLEDSAFWSFKKQPEADKCLFFVAMSRAIERIVFTFSKVRNTGWNKTDKSQSFNDIGVIYDALSNSKLVDMEEIK